MKTIYLLPNKMKKIGWIIFIPSFLFGTIAWFSGLEFDSLLKTNVIAIFYEGLLSGDYKFITVIKNGVLDEIIAILIIVGGLMVCFSKEKDEDEFIAKIRLESLVKAVYANYLVLLFAIVFVYDMSFFHVLVFNMFTTLLFFMVYFTIKLNKLRKEYS